MDKNFKFSQYADYIQDFNLLKKDMIKLEALKREHPTKSNERVFVGMKEIEKHYNVIKNTQSLSLMIEKVGEYEWRNLERMMKDALKVCEVENFSKSECISAIEEIQMFSLNSNLDDEHKVSVDTELEFYKEQQKILSKFQRDSVDDFNQNVKVVNEQISKINTPVILKMPILNKTVSNQDVLSDALIDAKKASSQFWPVGIAILAVALISTLADKRNKRILRNNFYKKLFQLRKNGGLGVRVFGKVDDITLKKFSKHLERIHQVFSKRKTFFGEIRFHLYENKKIVKLESQYISENPLQLFYAETSGEVSTAMKMLIAEIEEAGGEAIFSTKFSSTGAIESSSLSLYLAR